MDATVLICDFFLGGWFLKEWTFLVWKPESILWDTYILD